MTYRIVPITNSGCDCEECRSGRFLFDLQSFRDGQWCWSGMSMVTYDDVEDCRLHHDWGIAFPPGAAWEDGSPIVTPEEQPQLPANMKAEPGYIDPSSLTAAIRSLTQHRVEN